MARVWRTPSPQSSRAGSQVHPRTVSPRCSSGGTTLNALERRIRELEHLASSQSHELKIQFERIAQVGGRACDIFESDHQRVSVAPSINANRSPCPLKVSSISSSDKSDVARRFKSETAQKEAP